MAFIMQGSLPLHFTSIRYILFGQMKIRYTIIFCRFLATGDSYHTIASSYRLGISTVCGIVYETCDAIWKTMQPIYMPCPIKEDWVRIANDFEMKWNFPNCVGAVDGKHVVIKSPAKSGSMYFNYKGTFSVVLLAVVDANYSFVIIDGWWLRQAIRWGDAGDFRVRSSLEQGKTCFTGSKITVRIPYSFATCLRRRRSLPANEEHDATISRQESWPCRTYLQLQVVACTPHPGKCVRHSGCKIQSFSSYIGPATANG